MKNITRAIILSFSLAIILNSLAIVEHAHVHSCDADESHAVSFQSEHTEQCLLCDLGISSSSSLVAAIPDFVAPALFSKRVLNYELLSVQSLVSLLPPPRSPPLL